MPIVAIADGEIIPLGTGFVISPDGFLMTAKHVIESFTTLLPPDRNGNEFYKKYSLYALYVSNERHGKNNELYLGGMLPIRNVWFSTELDIAYCWVQKPFFIEKKELLQLPSVKLSPGVPKVGEKIIGFGYYQSQAILTAEVVEGKQVAEYKQETAFTTGEIVEIHSPKRDSSMLTFPCFQTSARFELGMSGGPIFNEKGFVCGVICSGYKEATDENGHVTYSSMIWPALGTSLEIKPSPSESVQMITAYEICKRGVFATDESINEVNLTMNEDGTRSVFLRR